MGLQEEHRYIIETLLKINCIPVAMELFPSTSEKQMDYIKGEIDKCDYFILILAGRYGTEEENSGLSYTELEYNYVKEKGLPFGVFLIKDIGELPNKGCEKKADRAEQFYKNRMYAY